MGAYAGKIDQPYSSTAQVRIGNHVVTGYGIISGYYTFENSATTRSPKDTRVLFHLREVTQPAVCTEAYYVSPNRVMGQASTTPPDTFAADITAEERGRGPGRRQ